MDPVRPQGAESADAAPHVDVYAVGNALKRAQHEFRLVLNDELARLDTNISQLNILRDIGANPGISSAQLARLGFHTPQTLGQQGIQMQKRGLIKRTPGEGRTLEHQITPKGERLLGKGLEIAREVHGRVLRDFDDLQLEELAATFRLIARRASEERAR